MVALSLGTKRRSARMQWRGTEVACWNTSEFLIDACNYNVGSEFSQMFCRHFASPQKMSPLEAGQVVEILVAYTRSKTDPLCASALSALGTVLSEHAYLTEKALDYILDVSPWLRANQAAEGTYWPDTQFKPLQWLLKREPSLIPTAEEKIRDRLASAQISMAAITTVKAQVKEAAPAAPAKTPS